jgi:hypothetical protein
MPDDSLLAGRTVAPSKPDNGTSRNSSGLSTDLVKIYKVCEFTIPSTFYYRFGVKRNLRTIAGIMPNGKLLLVAVDGHKPGYSVGASFKEEAAIMVSLKAKEAVNLDGSGSTTMTLWAVSSSTAPPTQQAKDL